MEATIPAKKPKNKIDYIFAYPKTKWEGIETSTYNVELSDHLPISVKVRLK